MIIQKQQKSRNYLIFYFSFSIIRYMKKITPILSKKQPLLWRQAIQQAEHRGNTLRNFLLKPIINNRFSFKNHSSFLFDYLIIGANPILTHLLVLKIYNQIQYLNKINNSEKSYHIGIILNDEPDYWAYHSFEKEDIWLNLQHQHNIDYGLNFNEFLKSKNDFFENDILQKCIIINDHNFDLSHIRYDSYINGYIIHVGDKKEKNYTHNFQPNMPTVLKGEHQICRKYKKQFLTHYYDLSKKRDLIKELSFSDNKTNCEDSEQNTHILLAKKVFLTSQPKDWLSYNVRNTSDTFFKDEDNNIFRTSSFGYNPSSLNSYAFGSAKHIAHDFYGLEKQSFNDMLSILSLDIRNIL